MKTLYEIRKARTSLEDYISSFIASNVHQFQLETGVMIKRFDITLETNMRTGKMKAKTVIKLEDI